MTPRVTWSQVRAFRLARQHLFERAPRHALVEVVRDICGVQAQVQSAAELQVWARLDDAQADDVRNALWQERTLVRTWCMRGTLHVLAADELPVYVAALRTHDRWWKGSWLRLVAHLSADELRTVLEAIAATLTEAPMRREQLAQAVAERAGAHAEQKLLSGWSELLKPAAFAGTLIAGPPDGQNVTFVRPDRWLRSWAEPSAADAWRHIVRRYLTVYGPATREDFARWWGMQPAAAGRILKASSAELAVIEIDARPMYVLQKDLPVLSAADSSGAVRLLPAFDVYTIGNRPRSSLVDAHFEQRVFRTAGWISPVVIVDGVVAATWSHELSSRRLQVRIDPFREFSAPERAAIHEEAERLGRYFDAPVSLAVGTPAPGQQADGADEHGQAGPH